MFDLFHSKKPTETTYTPAEVRYVHDLQGGRHLQQRWIGSDGSSEWVDVPEVKA